MEFYTGGLLEGAIRDILTKTIKERIVTAYGNRTSDHPLSNYTDEHLTSYVLNILRDLSPDASSAEHIDAILDDTFKSEGANIPGYDDAHLFTDEIMSDIDPLQNSKEIEGMNAIVRFKEQLAQNQSGGGIGGSGGGGSTGSSAEFPDDDGSGDGGKGGKRYTTGFDRARYESEFANIKKEPGNKIYSKALESGKGFVKYALDKIGEQRGFDVETYTYRKMLESPEADKILQTNLPKSEYDEFTKDRGSIPVTTFLNQDNPISNKWRNLLKMQAFEINELTKDILRKEIDKTGAYKPLIEKLYSDLDNPIKYIGNVRIKFYPKDAARVTNEYQALAYVARSFMPKGYDKVAFDRILDALATGRHPEVYEAVATLAKNIVSNSTNMLPKTHLSLVATIRALIALEDRASNALMTNNKLVESETPLFLENYYYNEDQTIRLQLDQPSQSDTNALEYVTPVLTKLVAQQTGKPVKSITLPHIISFMRDYFKRVDDSRRYNHQKYIRDTVFHFTNAATEWAKINKVSIKYAMKEIDIRLEYIDGATDELGLPDTSIQSINKIRSLKHELDIRATRMTQAHNPHAIIHYVVQDFSRQHVIKIFTDYAKALGEEAALDIMANKVFPYLDIRAMTINYYRAQLDNLPIGEARENLRKKIKAYASTGQSAGTDLQEFSIKHMRDIFKDVLAGFGKMKARTGTIFNAVRRIMVYKDLPSSIAVQKMFGNYKGTLQLLVDSMERQLKYIDMHKYFTVNGEIDLIKEYLKLEDVVRAHIDDVNEIYNKDFIKEGTSTDAKKVLKSTFIKGRLLENYRIGVELANYHAATYLPTPRLNMGKMVAILEEAFYTSALSGMIISTVVNDAVGVATFMSDNLKEWKDGMELYARSAFGGLTQEELNIVGGVLSDMTPRASLQDPTEMYRRKWGDTLYSNTQYATVGKMAALLSVNRRLAQAIINNDEAFAKRLNSWVGDDDLSWFEYLITNKDRFISYGEFPYVMINIVNDMNMHDKVTARLMSFSDIPVAEQNIYSSALKNSTMDLHPFMRELLLSLFRFRSSASTEFTNSFRMFTHTFHNDNDLFNNYLKMAMFQSFLFNYVRVYSRGGHIKDWKKFMEIVMIESPLLGVFGTPAMGVLDGDLSGFTDLSMYSALYPAIKSLVKLPVDFIHGHPRHGLYNFARGMSAYDIVRNFPVLSAIWRKYFLENLYDAIYPDNTFFKNLNKYGASVGVEYD
ncbi:MAG: hypothetical protein ACRCX2_10535 [Paraclostridium sp.]